MATHLVISLLPLSRPHYLLGAFLSFSHFTIADLIDRYVVEE